MIDFEDLPERDEDGSLIEYRPVVGWPNYLIGSDGSIWGRKTRTWRRLKPYLMKCGYARAKLSMKGRKTICIYVHQLVLEAFVGPRPEGMECCHNDGNGANSRLSNLRWDTHAANVQDAIRHGAHVRGDRMRTAKLSAADVKEIRRLRAEGWRIYRLAGVFGVSHRAVRYVLEGKTWTWIKEEAEA